LEAAFSRVTALAELIERLMRECTLSLDAALYRLNNLRLVETLAEQGEKGARIRLILDRGRYESDPVTRGGLAKYRLPFRLLHGRLGTRSKMHHKFAILDDRIVLTGSYNWTTESEQENYENVIVLREPIQVQQYREEFEALWSQAGEND
jgi:phosphatidylserine/phosphatidylglycerophosphate/cardiolipin synthase-like enzyme